MKINEVVDKETPGTYVGVKYTRDTQNQLANFIRKMGINSRTPRERFHTTILHSRKPCPDYKPNGNLSWTTKFKEWKIFPQQNGKNALVLVVDSPELIERHEYLMNLHNAVYDHDEYIPHITVSYDTEVRDVSDLPPYPYILKMDEEYDEPLNEYKET